MEERPATSSLLNPTAPSSTSGRSWIVTVLGVTAIAVIGLLLWSWLQGKDLVKMISELGPETSGDKAPTPIDGKTRTVIPAAEIPPGPGSDFGIQYWMYIADWNYKFGGDKEILKRISPSNGSTVAPRIFLSPNENTLNVQVSVFPSSTAAGAANPSSTSTTGDSFTCSVENVPLQSWFSVSATVFQRNLDIYINGRLVKSCVLPGIPKVAVGDLILNDAGGFSGSICNVHTYGGMLGPSDAKSFHAAGTTCEAPADEAGKPVDKDSFFITLFGYTFRFIKLDKTGKELSSYTL